MKSTREMLRRAAENRPADAGEACISPPVQESDRNAAAKAEAGRRMVAKPIRQNSVYRQLMRSHDRMSTRHLKG